MEDRETKAPPDLSVPDGFGIIEAEMVLQIPHSPQDSTRQFPEAALVGEKMAGTRRSRAVSGRYRLDRRLSTSETIGSVVLPLLRTQAAGRTGGDGVRTP